MCQMTRGTAVSRVYIHAHIYIYTRNSTGHDDFLVQVQLSNTLGLYTFHRRRNLDDTENEPTVWLHIVAAYLCAVHLLRHDVPASNNPVFNGNGLANRPPRYTHTHAHTRPVTLPRVFRARVSPPPPPSPPCHVFLIFNCAPASSSIRSTVPRPCAAINVTGERHALRKLNSRKIGRQRDHLSGARMRWLFPRSLSRCLFTSSL